MLDPYYRELDEEHYRRKYFALSMAALVIVILGSFMLVNSSTGQRFNAMTQEQQEIINKEPVLALHESANKMIFVFTIVVIVLFLLLRIVNFMSRVNKEM